MIQFYLFVLPYLPYVFGQTDPSKRCRSRWDWRLIRVYTISNSSSSLYIKKTCLYNFHPFKPHFYKVKWGLQGYTLFFLFFPENIDCEYSWKPPRWGGSNEHHNLCIEQKYKKYQRFFIWKFSVFGGVRILRVKTAVRYKAACGHEECAIHNFPHEQNQSTIVCNFLVLVCICFPTGCLLRHILKQLFFLSLYKSYCNNAKIITRLGKFSWRRIDIFYTVSQ